GGGGGRHGARPRRTPGAPPVPSTSLRQGIALRHLNGILEPRERCRSPLVVRARACGAGSVPHGHCPGFSSNSVSPAGSPRGSKRRSAKNSRPPGSSSTTLEQRVPYLG